MCIPLNVSHYYQRIIKRLLSLQTICKLLYVQLSHLCNLLTVKCSQLLLYIAVPVLYYNSRAVQLQRKYLYAVGVQKYHVFLDCSTSKLLFPLGIAFDHHLTEITYILFLNRVVYFLKQSNWKKLRVVWTPSMLTCKLQRKRSKGWSFAAGYSQSSGKSKYMQITLRLH